jgi:PAS domain S-box-containing protein
MSRLPTFEDNTFLTQIADMLLPRLGRQERESSPGWRIWSIGCQVGDEALLLLLSLHHRQQVPASSSPFTVFATDADVQAVTRARRLTASDHLEKVPSLAPYQSLLLREWDGLSLPEAWRRALIYAPHHLLSDMPFPHLDLIVVHSSLSSFSEAEQAGILNRMAYVSPPQGLLLLLGEQGSVMPDPALYRRDPASPMPLFQRTTMPVKRIALGLKRRAEDQPHASLLAAQTDRERDELIEELQAMLEEQEVLCEELQAQDSLNREAHMAQLHLAAIVSSSEEAILSKDLDGIVTSWNEGAERLYGYSAQEMVGQSVARIFPPDRQEELSHIMEEIRQGERVGNYETVRQRKDGSLVPVSVTISPVKESDGTIVGASDIAHDITPRRELEQQRVAFVDLVTHELKNPLTALFGNIQFAQRLLTRLLAHAEILSDEYRRILEEVLAMLGRSQQQMNAQKRLINDLLDLSHVQQDTLELLQEPCNLLMVVCETILNSQAAYSSRLIELDIPEQNDVLVYGDRDRLGQVLSNYLSNALKFAPVERPVYVGMSLQGATVRVWVRDEGPGLTPEQQAHIWDRYFQVPRTPVQEGWRVGLGLGLYLCRQLIMRQHGEVGVESTPGQGANFWFSLPIYHPRKGEETVS